jgi:predicted transcriptional regulator
MVVEAQGFRSSDRPSKQSQASTHPLRKWRRGQHLSLEAVAAELELSIASLSRIERGLQKPSVQIIARLITLSSGALDFDAFVG